MISRRSSEPFMETIPSTVNLELGFEQKSLNQQIDPQRQNVSNIDWEGYKEYLSNINKSDKEIQKSLDMVRHIHIF